MLYGLRSEPSYSRDDRTLQDLPLSSGSVDLEASHIAASGQY